MLAWKSFYIPGGKNTPRAWPRSSVAPLAHVAMALLRPRTSMVLLSSICYCSFGEVFDPRRTKNIPRALFKLLAAHAPHGLGLVFCHALFTAREYFDLESCFHPRRKSLPGVLCMCVCPANRLWSDTQFVKCTQMGAGIILKFQAEKFTRRAVPCAFAPRTAFGRIVNLFIVRRWLLEGF